MILTREETKKRIRDSYELPNMVLKADPVVSVRTSTYNHAPYIRECIEGVLMQETTFPFEYIIGEDFSTDGTREIVFDYAKRYPDKIRVITADYNVGVTANGGRCREASRGKYMALCEGDDYWTDRKKLQKQVAFLETHPEYSICYHDSTVVDEFGQIIKDSKLSRDDKRDFSSEELVYAAKVLPNTMCFRNVIREVPNESYYAFGGDKFLTSLLGSCGKGKYLDTIKPSAFRFHSGGINSGQADEYTKLGKHLSTRIALYQYYDRIGERAYAHHFLVNGIQATIQKMANCYKRPDSAGMSEVAGKIDREDLVGKYYTGANADQYEKRRRSNPKWQFETDTLRDVLQCCRGEITSVLDVPVGTGRFLPEFAALDDSLHVYGVDYSAGMLSQAAQAATGNNVSFIQKDILDENIDVAGDLSVCYRFLNLIEWPQAADALKKVLAATGQYAVFAIRTVDQQYTGSNFIEDKIYLHASAALDELVAACDFEVIKTYRFDDQRAGDYNVLFCRRRPVNVQANRINKNFRTVFNYGSGQPRGKIYQVENDAHAKFIRDTTCHPEICAHFPQINRIEGNHVDAKWVEGETVSPEDWQSVFAMLYKLQATATPGPSSFDYVLDLVIPRFHRAQPVFGKAFCERLTATIQAGASDYPEKLSHPDMIPGNIIASAGGYKIIDNELICRSRYHRIDILNALYNFGPEANAGDVLRIFQVSTAENDFLQALWAARQIGSFLIKEKFPAALEIFHNYQHGVNILPFEW